MTCGDFPEKVFPEEIENFMEQFKIETSTIITVEWMLKQKSFS